MADEFKVETEREPVIAASYIAVNEDGDWAVGQDEEEASERLRDDCLGLPLGNGR